MSLLDVKISKIKGISNGTISLPIDNGVFLIVGSNGSGKSTIMSCLAQLISRHNLGLLRKEDYTTDSFVSFEMDNLQDTWTCTEAGFWKAQSFPHTMKFNGMYEGSLFYGARFEDSKNVDDLIVENKIEEGYIVDADEYIIEHLGLILHNNKTHYTQLKRIRNKQIAKDVFKLKNTPYFCMSNEKLISQYRMSSGECLLISLLHFVYNSIIRRSLPTNEPILMLIDEIELALHPVAISNLIDLLNSLTETYRNLTVILTSHAPEVIRKVKPENTFKLELPGDDGQSFSIVTPCYPSYSIRDVYTHDGFDFLLLVEDELAKLIVKNAIETLNLDSSRLVNVTPVGGWTNVLKLHHEIVYNNILGVGKTVISILDGDIIGQLSPEQQLMAPMFLPVSSLEKFLRLTLVEKLNNKIKKSINDRFFSLSSIDRLIKAYLDEESTLRIKNTASYREDKNGKRLYNKIRGHLRERRISDEMFVNGIYEIIQKEIDFSGFHGELSKRLQ